MLRDGLISEAATGIAKRPLSGVDLSDKSPPMLASKVELPPSVFAPYCVRQASYR